MPEFIPADEHFVARVHADFDRQQLMKTIGATLQSVVPGEVRIAISYNDALTQQHGFLHGGIVSTIVDTACGYAAYTLMPAHIDVLSVEFKINFMAPARGESFIGIGRVIKAGRTLTICQGDLTAIDQGSEKVIASMQATLIAVERQR